MAADNSDGLSLSSADDTQPPQSSRKSSKPGNTSSRGPRKTISISLHEQNAAVAHRRHKRVWKACERCKIKKIKCDAESPCKHCRDDGWVCIAGSRKKAEFSRLPPGYTELLENTQHALIATVQKLYTMVRNGDLWDLGEPKLNDRGLPVTHSIVEKLNCIRLSRSLPCTLTRDAEDHAQLQLQMPAVSEEHGVGYLWKNLSEDPDFSLQSRAYRDSSSQSEQSAHSKYHNRILHDQHCQQWQDMMKPQSQSPSSKSQEELLEDEPLYENEFQQRPQFQVGDPVVSDAQSTVSLAGSDFEAMSNMTSSVPHDSGPSYSCSIGGDDLSVPAQTLGFTALPMCQQQQPPDSQAIPHSFSSTDCLTLEACMHRATRFNTTEFGMIFPDYIMDSTASNQYLKIPEEEMRRNTLDWENGFDLAGQNEDTMLEDMLGTRDEGEDRWEDLASFWNDKLQ